MVFDTKDTVTNSSVVAALRKFQAPRPETEGLWGWGLWREEIGAHVIEVGIFLHFSENEGVLQSESADRLSGSYV